VRTGVPPGRSRASGRRDAFLPPDLNRRTHTMSLRWQARPGRLLQAMSASSRAAAAAGHPPSRPPPAPACPAPPARASRPPTARPPSARRPDGRTYRRQTAGRSASHPDRRLQRIGQPPTQPHQLVVAHPLGQRRHRRQAHLLGRGPVQSRRCLHLLQQLGWSICLTTMRLGRPRTVSLPSVQTNSAAVPTPARDVIGCCDEPVTLVRRWRGRGARALWGCHRGLGKALTPRAYRSMVGAAPRSTCPLPPVPSFRRAFGCARSSARQVAEAATETSRYCPPPALRPSCPRGGSCRPG
jgi:hypothetical protein